jgi:hypothetical protein
MGRPPIGDAPMTPAERQRRARAVTKRPSVTVIAMTTAERTAILGVIRARERAALSDARKYHTVLIADFERKLTAIYRPGDHPVWKEAHAAAERVGQEAQAKVAATFRELGIPEDWAPEIYIGWSGRGENASDRRRVELRRIGLWEADKQLRAAEAAIKRAAVDALEGVIAGGLTSEAAHAMLASIPTPDQLMPPLEFEGVETIAAPDRNQRKIGDE